MELKYYRKKTQDYKKRIKNKQIIKFVDCLDIFLDWLDSLYKIKRIRKEQEKEIFQYFPKEIFNELEKISATEMSDEEYDKLKGILLKESSELVNFIINVGNLRMTDFDLLQFNLSRIFKKEEITTMVEWARQHLSTIILERKDEELRGQEEREKAQEIYFEKIRIMPQEEITKLIIKNMFDFSPKARTNEERIEAVKNNQKKLLAQRKKFENFERKLIDASQEAAEHSQTNVFRKIGEVKREMEEVRDKFREKSRQIVSPEGTRKELRKAKARILKAKTQTNQEILNVEKMFNDARNKFDSARNKLIEKKERLGQEQEEKRGFIQEQGLVQINRGKHTVDQARKHLDLARQHMENEKKGAEKLFESGRKHLALAKEHMEDEKQGTKKMFNKGRQYLVNAKKHLEKEQESFEKTKAEAENILGAVEARLKNEKVRGEKWVEKEKKRITLLESGLKERKLKEEKRIMLIRNSLLPKGRETAEKLKEKMMSVRAGAEKDRAGTDKLGVLVSEKPKLGIEKEEIQEKYKLKKEALTKQLQKKKQLFEYDLRFKRDELQQRALKQKEDMITKFEDFEERQRTLMARYRASKKAYMIRTLLKAIRTIH